MEEILVADTSVIVDLDHGALMPTCLAHTWVLTVPDILHEQEIAPYAPLLTATHGVRIDVLTASEMTALQALRRSNRALSISDAAAFVLAQSRGRDLLTGDKPLRAAADAAGIRVHGTLWVLDRFYDDGRLGPTLLHQALTAIAAHPKCRLPRDEIDLRLRQWR